MKKEELSEDIYALGRGILSRRRIEVDNRKSLEMAKFVFKDNLDKVIFTNDTKRELEASNQPKLKADVESLVKYHFETEMMQLEYEHKLRLFSI